MTTPDDLSRLLTEHRHMTLEEAAVAVRNACRTSPPTDEEGTWCASCQREHQRRERPIECREDGCRRMTDNYHGRCSEHR